MKGMMPTMGWVLVALALLVSFGVDFANMAQGGAIDLRNRITGVRLMEHGIDAYHYKWHEGEPAEYCDPFNNPNLTVSRTTSTPALLMLHLPLAVLPYRLAQVLWLFLQWLLLLGTGWLWLRACATSRARWLVALAVTGFTYTAAWRLHAERGQVYVLLTFFFAWWLTATLDPKARTRACGNGFIAGFLAGFLATLRPPFVLLVPFLALHRRGQLAGAAVGLLLGLGLPMVWEAGCWPDYFSAMRTNSELNWTHFYPHYTQAYPPRIEGVPTDILGHYVSIPFAEFSLPALWNWLGFAPLPDAILLLAAVAPFAVWLWFSRVQPVERLLPGLAAWFFLIDLFLPAYRNSYNDVFILDVVLLGLITAKKFPWAAWLCTLALPMGWAVYAFEPEQAWLINLPSVFFTLGAILFLFLFNNGGESRKVGAAC
jgi:glycosyl transferase family 87